MCVQDDQCVCLSCFPNASITCSEGGAHRCFYELREDAGTLLHLCRDSEKTAPLSRGSPLLASTMLVAERVTRGLLKGEGEKEEWGQRVKEKETGDEAREARR